jgi:ribonuclease HII
LIASGRIRGHNATVPAASKRAARKRRRAARLFRFDRDFGVRFVAGADEAGRGSLAGPLVAAAVLIDYENLSMRDRRALGYLDDSKQRSCEEREALYPVVIRAAARVAVTVRCVRGIDSRGLHRTNLAALARSLERVAVPGAVCLTDGFRVPECAVCHQPVIDGDARSAAIAGASVIAKVTRDRYMHRVAGTYPGFGFDENVGYSTPEHRAAIVERGPSDLHRRSFASIAYSQLELGWGVTVCGPAEVEPPTGPPPDAEVVASDPDPPAGPHRDPDIRVSDPDPPAGPTPDAEVVVADPDPPAGRRRDAEVAVSDAQRP